MVEDEMMGRAIVQPSLTISTPGDPYELEADRVADEVMRMPNESGAGPQVRRFADGATIDRQCASCAASESEGGDLGSVVSRGTSSGGQSLDSDTRGFMESRFGHDFGHVRVYSGGSAAQSARSINALAYTVGSDIVFGEGRYAPQTQSGKRLLAHELTHTIQQGGASVRSTAARRALAPASIQRWPLTVMRDECSGKSKGNCSGSCTHSSGKPGTCRWSGTIEFGCVCYENPTLANKLLMAALIVFLAGFAIILAAEVIAAIAACVATGVCEAAAIIGLAGASAGALIILFLKSHGVTVVQADSMGPTDGTGSAYAEAGGGSEASGSSDNAAVA